MIREFLRYWLGVEDNQEQLQEISDSLNTISEDVEALREDTVSSKDFSGLRSRVRELEGVGGEFTNREWEVIQVLLDLDTNADVQDLSEELETSKNNARAVLNNVKDKVELDVETQGRKKLYSIPEDTRKEIFSK